MGNDHPDTLMSMNNLALAYWQHAQRAGAIELYVDALELKRKKLGNDHLETQIGVANLGNVYFKNGQLDKAIILMEEASTASRQLTRIRWINGELMAAYAANNQPEKAKAIFQEFLPLLEAADAGDSLELADNYTSFALPLLDLKMYSDAERLFQRIYGIHKRLRPDHWMTFRALGLLGTAKNRQNRHEDARCDLEKAFAELNDRYDTMPANRRASLMSQLTDEMIALAKATADEQLEKEWVKNSKLHID